MNIVSAAVECPTCGAKIGDHCVEDGREIRQEHSNRILQDVVEIKLMLSKSTAYRICQMLTPKEDEDDEGFIHELMCVEIDLARATQSIWLRSEVTTQ